MRVHLGVHLSRDCSVEPACERRRPTCSPEEGLKAEACADAEDFRGKEDAAARPCASGRSDSAAAQVVLPFGNPAESEFKVSPTPVALRPTLARGVPLSVEFQRTCAPAPHWRLPPRARKEVAVVSISLLMD